MAPPPTTPWVLTDGRIGNERQALALAHALSTVEPRIWRLQARAPWKQASPRKLPGSEHAFGEEFRLALREPPKLAIGCGRQAALATRLLREAGARSVQILDPRIDPRHWDAVVVPEHDRQRGPNLITMIGSLHDVDALWLATARERFPQFAKLPSPRTLLLLGGPTRNVRLDEAWWQRTVETLRATHRRSGGSLSVCASPRTPDWMVAAARRDLSDLQGVRWLESIDGPNPYAGLVGWADRIVVSADSVNMVSEACATTVPVDIAMPDLIAGRPLRFLQTLMDRRRVRALDATDPPDPALPLQELQRVAARVRGLVDS